MRSAPTLNEIRHIFEKYVKKNTIIDAYSIIFSTSSCLKILSEQNEQCVKSTSWKKM